MKAFLMWVFLVLAIASNARSEDILVRPLSELKTKAAKSDAESQLQLGAAYAKGQGVDKDYTEAVKWYRHAAERGQALAQSNLGFYYANGRGVDKDYTEALRWYRKVAEQGVATAQHNLGVMYANGQDVDKDYTEAAKWYRKAAEQGDIGRISAHKTAQRIEAPQP